MKRTFIPLGLCVLFALLLAACSSSETTSNNTTANTASTNKTTTTTTTTTSTPATTTSPASTTTASSSGEKIGVAECDDFLTKYDACVSAKVPEAARVQYKATIEQWRKSWRALAANPQTKATLAQVCKTSVEQARQSMKSFGCDF